jgi:hypothetical protein
LWHIVFIYPDLIFFRTIVRDGKRQLIQKKVISVKLLTLVDYMLHKSPYWSSTNYAKRVPEQVRLNFLGLVEQQHNQGHRELEGDLHLNL